MKELTKTYGLLLQDKRVRGEQNKYEAFSRQRGSVLNKYRKVYQAYMDLQAGLQRAQQFYEEMTQTVDSLKKNIESFVENRRSEGGQLLGSIEAAKGSGADREQVRIKELMERMSLSPSTPASQSPIPGPPEPPRASGHRPPPLQPQAMYNSARSPPPPPISPHYQANGMQSPGFQSFQAANASATNGQYGRESYQQPYNPNQYGPVSPPAHQQFFSPPPHQSYQGQPSTTMYGQQQHQQQQHQQQQQPPQSQYGGQSMPPGWQPPPPPPGPPPSQTQDYSALTSSVYPSGPGGYAADPRRTGGGQSSNDPWAGLGAWK